MNINEYYFSSKTVDEFLIMELTEYQTFEDFNSNVKDELQKLTGIDGNISNVVG